MFTQLITLIPRRLFNLAGFLFCAGVLGYAIHVQLNEGLDPCPLCIFQRGAFLAAGCVFLLAAIHNAGSLGSRVYAVLIALASLAGAAIAGWHVRLQHLPPDLVPECGPGLDYMLEVFPLSETLKKVFTGSGECAEVSWQFLGLSMPTWALLCFIGLAVGGFFRNWLARD
ncbi:MAG: disulfide bond formation protein B [Gammaproteobacteria bacterium]|nr:disulfide bond formation protein B [Gammaproteobacteria bacterium]